MNKIKPYYWISLGIFVVIAINILAYALLVELGFHKTKTPSDLPFIIRYAPIVEAILTVMFIGILRLFLLKRAPINRPISSYIWRLFIISIISYILCDPIAIYGLLFYMISGNKIDFYLVWGLSMLLLALYFPRYGRWEKYINSKVPVETK